MSGTDFSDSSDPDLFAADSDGAWLEIRCAFPLAGTPPVPGIPWQALALAVRSWKQVGLCDFFFFVRKPPGMRMRFSCVAAPARLRAALSEWLSEMTRQRWIEIHAEAVYEPEERRFGGREGMTVAHNLWSADAQLVLDYECLGDAQRGSVSRAALWAMSVNDLLRLSLDDTAEIWDVWCRISDAVRRWHAEAGDLPRARYRAMAPALFEPSPSWLVVLRPAVRNLVERSRAANFRAAQMLEAVAGRGVLKTGRRAWLAANSLFQANRWGVGLDPADFCAVTLAMEHLLQPDGSSAVG